MTTSVPPIVFSPTGAAAPAESDILTGVLSDMNSVFNGTMNTSLSSPQGQLAQSYAAIIGEKNDEVLEIVNQINPDVADGRWQDAIGRIYFLNRIAASGTLVTATLRGLSGTVIPAGTLAQDTAGNVYASLAAGTISSSGTVNIDFQCTTTGPIVCAIGALNTIYKGITGWDSITNTAAGTPGVDVESRSDFEFRRRNSVGINSLNSIQAVRAAVLSVADVLDAYVIDNSTSAVVNTGSTAYPVAAQSIYVAVAGGAAADIAYAIWSKKSLGCVYNGSTSYTYTDTSGGVAPYPTYTIKWVTPASLPVHYAVSLTNNPALPSNITALVQQAILNAFNGTDGGTRARIGSTLVSGRYYAGVNATDLNVEILSIFLGTAASPTATSLSVGIDQRPTLDVSNIAVTLV